MKLKINPRRDFLPIVNLALFIIMIFLKAYGDAMIANDIALGFVDNLKYVVLIFSSALCMLQLVKDGRMKNIFVRDFKRFWSLIAILVLISLVFCFNATVPRTYSIKYWLYIIFAFVYSFGMINILNKEMLITYFKVALVICFGCYLVFEKGTALFSLSNLKLVSFAASVSPFESSYSAGSSIAMCAFFCYYRKNNVPWLVLSMLFCFLTFKRASVIMMTIYFLVPIFFDKDRIVKRRTVFMWGFFFVISTILMAYAFKSQNIGMVQDFLHVNIDQLFMGRIRIYNSLLNANYKIAGLGTSIDLMNYAYGKTSGIELELVQLLMEVSIVGLVAFISYCISLAKRNLYCLTIILFTLFNMLTSSSLSSPIAWIFTYLTVWGIYKNQFQQSERIQYEN
jgi:Uncharacterized protein conserved in bacteria containing a divergent form of TPR repeats